MRILYSLIPPLAPEQKETAKAALLSVLPGADVSFDNGGDLLSVEVPYGMTPDDVSRTVTGCFAEHGITVAEMRRDGPMSGTPQNAPFSPFAPGRPAGGRTVRLSTFIVSLIAAVLAAVILTFGGTMGVLYLIGLSIPPETLGTYGDDREDYAGKIGLVDDIFSQYSLYDIDGNLLLDEMLKAYAAATGDDYAAYYTATELAEMLERSNSKMVGIGITVKRLSGTGMQIIEVMPGSPAEAAGLLPGNVIVAIKNGDEPEVRCDVEDQSAAMSAITGAVGTAVTLTVKESVGGAELPPMTITRAEVEIVSALGRVSQTQPTVGIIRITEFDTATPRQFKAAVADLQSRGCTSFVLDLRNNPGGDIKPLMAIASYFLQENDVVYTERHKTGSPTSFSVKAVAYTDGYYNDCSITAEEIGQYRGLKFSVLVNENTASAAELLTATVRDYQLATVVGTKTFGKGIMQSIIDLAPYGYSGGLKLTVGYYDPPSGVNYHGVGITPGVEVALDAAVDPTTVTLLAETADPQLMRAIQEAQN